MPIDELATARLQELLSCRHREALARAVRRNVELGAGRSRLAPPVAGLLARNQADAARVAAGLEGDDPDPRAVIEVQRLLEDARPTQDRLAWIARVLAPDSRAPAPGSSAHEAVRHRRRLAGLDGGPGRARLADHGPGGDRRPGARVQGGRIHA